MFSRVRRLVREEHIFSWRSAQPVSSGSSWHVSASWNAMS